MLEDLAVEGDALRAHLAVGCEPARPARIFLHSACLRRSTWSAVKAFDARQWPRRGTGGTQKYPFLYGVVALGQLIRPSGADAALGAKVHQVFWSCSLCRSKM